MPMMLTLGMPARPPRTNTLLGSAGSWLPGRITTGRPASASRRPVRSSTGAGTRLLSKVSPASRTMSARAARAAASTAARPSVPSPCLVAEASSSTCKSEEWTRRRSTEDGGDGGMGGYRRGWGGGGGGGGFGGGGGGGGQELGGCDRLGVAEWRNRATTGRWPCCPRAA